MNLDPSDFAMSVNVKGRHSNIKYRDDPRWPQHSTNKMYHDIAINNALQNKYDVSSQISHELVRAIPLTANINGMILLLQLLLAFRAYVILQ